MARVAIVVNPMAARASSKVVGKMESAFKGAGWAVDVLETTGPGDAEKKAREASSDTGLDVVAAYGGDGTMNEVVTGVFGSGIPVGLLPGGTGNVLAGNLRLPRNPVAAALTITKGKNRCIDLGKATVRGDEKFFAVACGAGFEARLMETSTQAKRKWGVGAYVAHGIGQALEMNNSVYKVTVDGKTQELPAASLTVANCKEIVPPIMTLHDEISLDDGFLNVLAIDAKHIGHAFQAVFQMLTGLGSGRRLVSHIRGSEILVECEDLQPIGLDGEIVGTTPFKAEVLPGALKVVVSS